MKELIDCAMRREKSDLVVKNVRIFNVFSGETEEGEVAVKSGTIVGVGRGYEGEKVFDGGGKILLPGLIDSHIHVESSMLAPETWVGLCSPHGTTAVIADPHEIVNVCGVEGAEYIKEAISRIEKDGVCPVDVMLELPSCVPATPFETSGAALDGSRRKGDGAGTFARDVLRPRGDDELPRGDRRGGGRPQKDLLGAKAP